MDRMQLQDAQYRNAEDTPFLPNDVFSMEMFVPGICVTKTEEGFCLKQEAGSGSGAFVVPGVFGSCYEVKFPEDAGVVLAITTECNPRALMAGETISCQPDVCLYDSDPSSEKNYPGSFMFVCRKKPEYLVVCLSGAPTPIYMGQRFMLCPEDTSGPWFYPDPVGTISDPDGTFGNYQWNAEQVIENLYEPYRKKYPEYITRTHIGKDQSGVYDMYGYIFAPPAWKSTMFLTGGVHGNEESAYFALAKLLQLICDADASSPLLYMLRNHVRFVVVPVVNVWGVSQGHRDEEGNRVKRIRCNSANADLNRDFGETTQQESKNVLEFFRGYADQVDIAIDFHNSKAEDISMWYNFINHAVNSQANYKTTNHMYHRLMELGLCRETPNISKIPGSYWKRSVYIEGRIWNEFGVPTITVEHVINDDFPPLDSSEGVTLGVETYGNFLIQNALFFIQRSQE